MLVNFFAKRRRCLRISYETKLFRQRLSPDEELEVSALVAEREKLLARAAGFSATLPDACGVLPAITTPGLPRAATVADAPVATWNWYADRRFTRKFSMRGRARGNPRVNLDCQRNAAEVLETMNMGRCSNFTEEEQRYHCAYYVDASGARMRASTVFAGRAGSTLYLSRKERNRIQHALSGNTAPCVEREYCRKESMNDCELTVTQVTAACVLTALHCTAEYYADEGFKEGALKRLSCRDLWVRCEAFAKEACEVGGAEIVCSSDASAVEEEGTACVVDGVEGVVVESSAAPGAREQADAGCTEVVAKSSAEQSELWSARRLRRFERLASTKTLEGFYAARVLQSWAPRFGGRRGRNQGRKSCGNICVHEKISVLRCARFRAAVVKTCRPCGLPNGKCRSDVVTEAGALWCLRAGLAARRAGTMRVRRVRSVGPRAVKPCRVYACVPCGTSACGQAAEGPRLLDFGSRLGRWHKKCLQNAVLGLCSSSQKDAVRKRLPHMCWNNRGAGLAGGVLEAKNFRSVEKVLRCFGKRVSVFDVQRTADFFVGRCLGVWSLGAVRGTCLGSLVWSRADQHVYVVDGESVQACMSAIDTDGCVSCAPWIACNVGAPKKASKRGHI